MDLNEKPSTLRAWLKASYTNSEGQLQDKIFVEFIETDSIKFGDGLTGIVSTSVEMKLKIPKVNNWLTAGCKVSLIVGLVKSYVVKPTQVNPRNVIVDNNKLLNYKRE